MPKKGERVVEVRRSKMLGVTLTPKEWKAIDDFSASQGLYASSWARLVLIEAVEKGSS